MLGTRECTTGTLTKASWGVAEELQIEIRRDGDRVLVGLTGNLCSATAATFSRRIGRVVDSRPTVVRLDLRRTFVDSFGLAALVEMCARCRRADTTVELVSPPSTRMLLTGLGFPRRFRWETGKTVRVIAAEAPDQPPPANQAPTRSTE